jgi:hypothetical protein
MRERPRAYRLGSPTLEVHGNVMVAICEDAQREGNFIRKQRLQPSSLTALLSPNSFSLNLTEISATLLLKRARWIVNVAHVWVRT